MAAITSASSRAIVKRPAKRRPMPKPACLPAHCRRRTGLLEAQFRESDAGRRARAAPLMRRGRRRAHGAATFAVVAGPQTTVILRDGAHPLADSEAALGEVGRRRPGTRTRPRPCRRRPRCPVGRRRVVADSLRRSSSSMRDLERPASGTCRRRLPPPFAAALPPLPPPSPPALAGGAPAGSSSAVRPVSTQPTKTESVGLNFSALAGARRRSRARPRPRPRTPACARRADALNLLDLARARRRRRARAAPRRRARARRAGAPTCPPSLRARSAARRRAATGRGARTRTNMGRAWQKPRRRRCAPRSGSGPRCAAAACTATAARGRARSAP